MRLGKTNSSELDCFSLAFRYLCKKTVCSMRLIELNLQQIIELCRKYKVKTLSVFGSILTDKFNDDSDVDLLVNFNSEDIEDYVSNYFGLKESLSELFGRKVDLIEEKGLRNKYFIGPINRTKKIVYE